MDQFNEFFDISRLISGYLKDDLDESEQQQLENWLNVDPENRAQFERLTSEGKLQDDFSSYGQTDKISAWKRIVKETGYRKTKAIILIYRIAAAASIVMGATIGGYFLLHKQPKQQFVQNQYNDIAPGGNKAILTLSNGQKNRFNGC